MAGDKQCLIAAVKLSFGIGINPSSIGCCVLGPEVLLGSELVKASDDIVVTFRHLNSIVGAAYDQRAFCQRKNLHDVVKIYRELLTAIHRGYFNPHALLAFHESTAFSLIKPELLPKTLPGSIERAVWDRVVK